MNMEAIRVILWRTIGLVSVGSALWVCTLVAVRSKWPSVAVRAITTILLIVGIPLSVLLVFRVAELPVRLPAADDRWIHEAWIHPSPILAAIPAVVGAVAGGIYSLYLRRRQNCRVA